MSVDLKISGLTGGMSVLAMEDELVILEHGAGQDRVKKIPYENIESIIVWKIVPWWKVILTAVVLGPLIYLFVSLYLGDKDIVGGLYAAYVLVGLLTVLEALLLIRRETRMRINHGMEPYDLTVAAFPGKVRRFVEKTVTRAQAVQQELRERRAETHSAADGEAAPKEPENPTA